MIVNKNIFNNIIPIDKIVNQNIMLFIYNIYIKKNYNYNKYLGIL